MKKILNFYSQTAASIFAFLKIILLSRFRVKFPKTTNTTAIVLGNGPSLNLLLENEIILEKLKQTDTICVNAFYKSAYFKILKPKYYIITGLEFWEDNFPHMLEGRLQLYQALANEVDWPMYFFIPYFARKKKFWQDILETNPNIKIQYFNYVALDGFTRIKHLFFDLKWGHPRLQNVVGSSMMCLIWMGYKVIYLTGVEHSWLSHISVNKENDTLIGHQHFFNTNLNTVVMPKENNESKKLHEVLHKFYTTFKGYWDVKGYADKKNIKIINLTEPSYIDAFEKKNVDEVL
jgi:hypothetical protein